MQRLFSILLLMVLGIGPAVSAVPSNTFAGGLLAGIRAGVSGQSEESQLPACCRRNGKHHCALTTRAYADGFKQETSIGSNDCCPCAPTALDSTAPAFAAILNAGLQATISPSELRSLGSLPAAIQALDRRTQPQRGPPALPIA